MQKKISDEEHGIMRQPLSGESPQERYTVEITLMDHNRQELENKTDYDREEEGQLASWKKIKYPYDEQGNWTQKET